VVSFFFFLLFSTNLSGCKLDVCHTSTHGVVLVRMPKNFPSGHHCTTLSDYIFATKAHVDSRKKIVKQQCLPTCPHNMVNFGSLTAEICWRVWGSPANFNGFSVLAALLHCTLVVVVSQTAALNRGATYIRQGGHHVGHWPTFLVSMWFVVGVQYAYYKFFFI